jgi:hypothetical protein
LFSTGSGTAILVIDRSLILTDLFFGAGASTILGNRVRLYGGVGPNVVIGWADYEDELRSDSDTDFGFGGYARGGVELRLPDRNFLGVGVRWVANEIDFELPIGEVDVEGWQVFLTYTTGF